MFQYFINLRFLFFILYISQKFSLNLSKTILLCYNEKFRIACENPNDYLIIKNSTFGCLKSFKPNSIQFPWCNNSNLCSFYHNCKISLLNRIAQLCSGKKSCNLNVVFSKYIPKDLFPCKELFTQNQLLSLYIDYECVAKELFISVADLKNVQLVGGYITSVAYIHQKTSDSYDFKLLAASYAEKNLLPIKVIFRPITLLGKQEHHPIVFQFQILQNTLSYPSQNNAILSNSTNTCQMGKLYSQDYYAFNSDHYLLGNETNSRHSIIACQYSPDNVGRVYEMENATGVFITANVNFDPRINRDEGLLIKYIAIFCPLLNITNAKVSYDNKISRSKSLSVNVFATVQCDSGYFFLSSNRSSKVTSMILSCDHNKAQWDNQPIIPDRCVNHIPVMPTSSIVTVINATMSSWLEVSSESAQRTHTVIYVNGSYIAMSTDGQMSIIIKSTFGIVSLFFIVFCAAIYIYLKNKNKIKCLSKNCIFLSKLFSKQEETIHANSNNTFGNRFEGFVQYRPIGTPISGSLGFIRHSLSESYRQSNRTLITRADSRPTMTSRDSFPTSNNVSAFDVHNVQHNDELPTKVPKQSPIMKILRSASTLKNHSLGVFRPMSLSRQSFNDRCSNFYDGRSSNSQIALLKSRRSNVASEFMDDPSIMWTSDISPSKTMPKSNMPNKRDSEFSNNSSSDLSLRYIPKIYSPTVDTYLEPTLEVSNHLEDYSQKLSSRNEKNKNEDYMIYDHSRVSSNNIDFTCPSSITGSCSDTNNNENEENKRFSMISNNYYGIPSSNMNPNGLRSRVNDPITERIKNKSTESVYESIDEDPILIRIFNLKSFSLKTCSISENEVNLSDISISPMKCQNTLERRNLALPPPPNE